LLSLEANSQKNTRFVPLPSTPLHTDFKPVLEYAAERVFFTGGYAQRWKTVDERASPRSAASLARYLQHYPLSTTDFEAFHALYSSYGWAETTLFRSLLCRWRRGQPDDPGPFN
jgi:hypothetical protein